MTDHFHDDSESGLYFFKVVVLSIVLIMWISPILWGRVSIWLKGNLLTLNKGLSTGIAGSALLCHTCAIRCPRSQGVDVPNWSLAAGAAVVLTPAAAYAYLLRQGRQRRAFFAATPQPEEKSVMFANLDKMVEWNDPLKSIPITKQMAKELGPSFGMRLPRWLFPKGDFIFLQLIQRLSKRSSPRKTSSTQGWKAWALTRPFHEESSPWRQKDPFHRRLVAPLFSDKLLQGYSEQVFEKAELLRYILKERIQATKSVEAVCDLQLCLELVTLDIISSIGFGFNSNSVMTLLPHSTLEPWAKQPRNKSWSSWKPLRTWCTRHKHVLVSRSCSDIHRYLPWRWARKVIEERITNVLNSGDTSKVNMLKVLQNAHEGDRKMSRAEGWNSHTVDCRSWDYRVYHIMGTLWSGSKPESPRENCCRNICSRSGLTPLDTRSEFASLHMDGLAGGSAFTVFVFPRGAEADTTLGGK